MAVNPEPSILLDSNIIIYFANKALSTDVLLPFGRRYVSVVSRIEVLSAPHLETDPVESELLNLILQNFTRIELTHTIVDEVIRIRRQRKIAVPDAIIAATARVHNLVLVTADLRGFPSLLPPSQLFNPLA